MHNPHSLYSGPEGARLPALERNILKYRALQILLCLFYAEQIKSFILNTIGHKQKNRRKSMKIALAHAVAEGILSHEESDELWKLIAYRNVIAHEVQHLVDDVSPIRSARDVLMYKYDALNRLKFFNDDMWRRVRHRYTIVVSLDPLVFAPVEMAYVHELKRLGGTIDRQYAARKRKIDKLNTELTLEGTEFVDDLHPRFPANRRSDGRLTKRGIEICYRLFDLGKSRLAVAYIMGMTYRSACSRFKAWQKAGGKDRCKADIRRTRR